MSFKIKDHTVRQQSKTEIEHKIPVIPVDTSISNLSTQRRQPLEAVYTGDGEDINYKTVGEQREIFRTTKAENAQAKKTVQKYQENQKFLEDFEKSKVQPPKPE